MFSTKCMKEQLRFLWNQVKGFRQDQAVDPNALPTQILGRTNRPITIMTLGGGHFRDALVQPETIHAIIERAYELGIRSFDSAPEYEESQIYLGEALKPHRKHIFISSKVDKANYRDARIQLENNLKVLQTDTLDLASIHCFGYEPLYPDVEQALGKDGVLAALIDAKEDKLIRHIGASGHIYPARYRHLLERDEIDVYMCAVNFVIRFMYNFEEKVFEPARQKNCGLIAMKVLGGASNWEEGIAPLCGDHYDNAIRYAMGLPGVSTVNIGVRKIEELELAVDRVRSYKPLSDEELESLLAFGKNWAEEHIRLYKAGFYGNPMA